MLPTDHQGMLSWGAPPLDFTMGTICLPESRGPVALPVAWTCPLPTLSLYSGVTSTRKALWD